jgi:hypothetical protein
MSKEIREMINKVKTFNQFINEEKYNYDLTKSDPYYINRENNKEINKIRDENKYTQEERKIAQFIESELEKIGLVDGVDYNRDQPQDEYGTKTERFGYLFWIKKLDAKFGHHNVDKLLAQTNLKVTNPYVGSSVHGYIMRILNV